jgi:hypothetical protein
MVQHQSVAMLMQENGQRVVHVLSLDDRSTNCGTTKKEYEVVRQTDGERFFEDRVHIEFAKDFPRSHPLIRDNYDTEQIVKKYVMRSCILCV